MDGDFILVDKFRYGLRLPLTNTKVLSTWEPQRGDVMVFKSTSGPPINLIKRLVGLPGDHVVVRDNRVRSMGHRCGWSLLGAMRTATGSRVRS